MTKIAVVFHSGYGYTVKQAEAVAKGGWCYIDSY